MMADPSPQPGSSRRPQEVSQEVIIGSFKRLSEIGRGSFATVYKAVHVVCPTLSVHSGPLRLQDPNHTKSYVAIKSVNLSKLNKKLKDNLSLEIEILRRLHHPHIVGLIDKKESSSHIHLVMEYCALGDLSYFIKKRDTLANHETARDMMIKYPNPKAGGLNEVVARHFLKQLASALQFLRAKNLIHRDVKPQNLLLNPSPIYYVRERPPVMPYTTSDDSLIPATGIESLPILKLADFGFARSLPSTSLAETLCGSPLYMAPEILRYEKYDAKADLWSVGTVMYEVMTGRPPFRASNHVELLRRIEKGEDRIKFAEDVIISDPMKKLIRGLLKRNPVERMSFQDFFGHGVIIDEIPGLVGDDKPRPREIDQHQLSRRKSSLSNPPITQETIARMEKEGGLSESPRYGQRTSPGTSRPPIVPARISSGIPARPSVGRRITGQEAASPIEEAYTSPVSPRRPNYQSHATAPGQQELYTRGPTSAAVAMERQPSRNSRSPTPSLLREQIQEPDHERSSPKHEEKEREKAAQDVAFERDYVLVEKRAVEVNAFADELAASPRLATGAQGQRPPSAGGAMVRRATTQGAPTSTTGAQTTQSRAVQIASGQRPDAMHHRQSSYERRYGPSPSSATSAISKALNMASGRLFGMGFSPPISLGRGGRSPPMNYSPFPAYPTTNTSLVLLGDNGKPASDEDTRTIQIIEECATRSDVVYGFAEVKYRQLIPLAPSAQTHPARASSNDSRESDSNADEGLTVEAVLTIAEEALVLYVKALSSLARSMDIAGSWWARKNRGEILPDNAPPRVTANAAVGQRVNNVVQWVRARFNEVLEKAEFTRLKLIESQKRLPSDHPSHPNNHSIGIGIAGGIGNSVDNVVVSSGVTAEKLMYDRALEMSRTAAINELTGEDLNGCEIAYVTAIRMLEAVLENDDESTRKIGDKAAGGSNDDDAPIAGMEAEERQTVTKRMSTLKYQTKLY